MTNAAEKVVNIEEFKATTEKEEEAVNESFNAGSLVAGFVGGALAYALIGGARKLSGIIVTRWKAHKQATLSDSVGTNDDEAAYFDEDDSE